MAEEKSAAAEIREKLAKLRELRDTLDSADAVLGGLVPSVEKMFASLHLGVPISIEMEEGNGWTEWVSFEKVNKSYRLCVKTTSHDGPEEEVTPVSDLPRDTRAAIMDHYVPRLLDAAIEQMGNRIQRRRQTIESTTELIKTVDEFLIGDQHTTVKGATVVVPYGQDLPPVTPRGEIPGPPAVPAKQRVGYDLAGHPLYRAVMLPDGAGSAKIVDDGTKPKPKAFPRKPGSKL